MIYFTSDTHFWHKAIIKYCNRPVPGIEKAADFEGQCPPGQIWTENVEKMNEWLIERWNSVVKKDDTVWHLGDYAFCGPQKAGAILERLNGRKKKIRGNHDYGLDGKLPWDEVHDYKLLRVNLTYEDENEEVKQYSQPIVLCHFPILSWDGMAHGSWHLHGHCHGSIDSLYNSTGLRMDVGVDAVGNDWKPVSLDEIRNRMALRTVVPVDHHTANENNPRFSRKTP